MKFSPGRRMEVNGMSEGTPSSPPLLQALATSLVSIPLFLKMYSDALVDHVFDERPVSRRDKTGSDICEAG
jgi:hypothetical protein